MKKLATISIMGFLLVACASKDSTNEVTEVAVEDPIEYLDLTSDKSEEFKEYWVVEKRGFPQYPIKQVRKPVSGCVELIVGVKKDGTSGGYKVIQSYPEGLFDDYAALSLNDWKWTPTAKNVDKTPVLTVIKMEFKVSQSKNKTEFEKHCELN